MRTRVCAKVAAAGPAAHVLSLQRCLRHRGSIIGLEGRRFETHSYGSTTLAGDHLIKRGAMVCLKGASRRLASCVAKTSAEASLMISALRGSGSQIFSPITVSARDRRRATPCRACFCRDKSHFCPH